MNIFFQFYIINQFQFLNMYALVKFFDNVQYVCNSKNITVKKGVTYVKYSDRRMYPANIIAKNDDKKLLQQILQNIYKNVPYITCERLNDINSIRIVKTNLVRKEATIHTIALENSVLDNNKSINCIDGHTSEDKIDILKEECDYQQNTGVLTTFDIKTLDINTLHFIDENGYIIKTYTQDADYVHQKNSGISIFVENIHDLLQINNIKVIDEGHINVYDTMANNAENNDILITDMDNSLSYLHHQFESTVQNCVNNQFETIAQNCVNNQFETTAQNCVKKLNFSDVDNDNGNNDDESEYVPSANEYTSDNNISLQKESVVKESVSESSLDTSKINIIGTSCNDEVMYVNNDDESEYMPSANECTLSDNNISLQKESVVKESVSESSLDISKININTSCNDEVMYVNKSNIKSKQNCCVFCLKLQSQLARHLETVHRDKDEVKKFAILPKKSEERKKIIDILRKQGNFMFNTNENLNTGQLIVSRRPNVTSTKTATDFIACSKCKGFFAKTTIRHHSRKCQKKDFTKNKTIMIMGRRVTSRLHHLSNEMLKKVFSVMRDDEVTRIIRYDELLIIYANKLCTKYKAQHQHDMIRARLRVLGRFLLALKKINKDIEGFQSIYHPKVYDNCISAINIVAGYNDEEKIYKAPATASTLSTLIKQIGNVFIAECIKKEDVEKKNLIEDFLKLLTVDIGISVNETETQTAKRRHKKVLPSQEEINSLYKYLKKTRLEAYMALQKSFSYSKWLSLAKVTLTSVHVFNRWRAEEVERALIEDFKTYEKVNEHMNSDIYNTLSTENRKIAEKYVRFCIRGKLGRTVPVLLSNELFDCITLILEWRKEANVPRKNPYIFGLPDFNNHRYKYLRACVLMRQFAKQCNVNYSTTLRGTALRKQIATYCIQLNLNDVEISELATFMGHADKIYKQTATNYRQPQASRDILKISQYLEAVQSAQDLSNESSSDSDENLNDSFNVSNDIDCSNTTEDVSPSVTEKTSASYKDKDNNKKQKRSTSPYGKTKRMRWTETEKETVLEGFAKHMENLTLPSLKEIQEMKKKYTLLAHRTSPQIKTWLHNKQKTLKRT